MPNSGWENVYLGRTEDAFFFLAVMQYVGWIWLIGMEKMCKLCGVINLTTYNDKFRLQLIELIYNWLWSSI